MLRRFIGNRVNQQESQERIEGALEKRNEHLLIDDGGGASSNNAFRTKELTSFDICIGASDEMASTSTSSGHFDPKSGLVNCSVLVSADGEMLLIPREFQKTGKVDGKNYESRKCVLDHSSTDSGEEYDSAVFLGNDLVLDGDKNLNGFSAKGWSIPAVSLAIKQSADAVGTFSQFVESLVTTKQSIAAQENQMINHLRPLVEVPETHGIRMEDYLELLREAFPEEYNIEIPSQRVGPLAHPKGSLHATVVALDNYYSTVAESESRRWRALADQNGPLSKIKDAKLRLDQREVSRRTALSQMMLKKKQMEEHLTSCKEDAARKWNEVHDTEERVTLLLGEKMLERNRMKERKRIEEIRRDEKKRMADAAVNGNIGASPDEILDIVSAFTAGMEDGAFEPMGFPQVPSGKPQDSAQRYRKSFRRQSQSMDAGTGATLPIVSRHDLEHEIGLPERSAAALAADEAVEDASTQLLAFLSNWDVTNRSSRLAAESCLIGSCNAHAKCIRSIIEMEKEAIEDRMNRLHTLEAIAFNMNVREDIDNYIARDKNEPGGRSMLDDDDDGGVAAAFTVLENHANGNLGPGSTKSLRESISNMSVSSEIDEEIISPKKAGEVVAVFFIDDPLLRPDANTEEEETTKARDEFESELLQLCKVVEERKNTVHRSTVCLSLNAKRNDQDAIATKLQFDGLCRLFSSILSGCDPCGSGASLTKILMTLSQIFFCRDIDLIEEKKKVFVKARLVNHPLWRNDDLWDHLLYQDIAENLTHSGLMDNFESREALIPTVTTRRKSEWTDSNTMKWHDLKESDRYDAATQVHAIILAQLGTLAHTMIEFGCGLHRSCAFVRRIAVRNQLPMSQRTLLLQHLMRIKM